MVTNFEGKLSTELKMCNDILPVTFYRCFTRRLLYNEHLSYSDRLELLKIETLEQGSINSDLTMFLKCIEY